jgi:HEAT repeat protein
MLWWQLRRLASRDPKVRLQAVDDLAKERNPRAVPPLIALLARNPQRDPRVAAAYALGFIGDRRALEPLVAALGDAHAGVRQAAALAIGAIGQHENRGSFVSQARAAGVKGSPVIVGYEGAIAGLAAALSDPAREVRLTAADSLGKLGDQRGVQPLMEVLADPVPEVRSMAACALSALCDRRSVPPLLSALGDGDAAVRRASVRALGEIADRAALGPLAGMLDDVEPVRTEAAFALAKLTDRRAIAPLAAILKQRAHECRRIAADALAYIAAPEALGALAEYTDDADDHVRRVALAAGLQQAARGR